MAFALRGADQDWTAERFLETDQHGVTFRMDFFDGVRLLSCQLDQTAEKFDHFVILFR